MAGYDDERGERDELSQTGRVRIIGAAEAGKVAGAGAPRPEEPEGRQRRDEEWPDGGEVERELPGEDRGDGGEQQPAVEMPHWTEPATGEVPSILVRDDDPAGTGLGSSRTAPVWKGEHTQWAEESIEYEHSQLADDGIRLGAMDQGSGGHYEGDYGDEAGYGSGDYGDEAGYGSGDYGDEEGYGSGDDGDEEGSVGPAATTGSRSAADAAAGGGEPYRHVRVRGASRSSRRAGARGTGGTRVDAVTGAGDGTAGGREAMGRNMWVALGTGLLFGGVSLLMFKEGTVSSLALCVVLVTVAAAELFSALRRAGYVPATLLGLAGTVFVMIAAYLRGVSGIVLSLVLVMVFTMLWYLAGVVRQRPVPNISVTLLGFAWVGILGSFAGLLLDPSAFPHRHGVAFLVAAGLVTVAHDIGGLMVGRAFGAKAHLLAPRVSPKKTWEGLVGASVLAIAVSMVIVRFISPWSASSALGLALIVVVVAPLGDLCESMVKRDLGLKDMGSLLPGHGGMLDRVDAVLFVLPAVYYMVMLAHIG